MSHKIGFCGSNTHSNNCNLHGKIDATNYGVVGFFFASHDLFASFFCLSICSILFAFFFHRAYKYKLCTLVNYRWNTVFCRNEFNFNALLGFSGTLIRELLLILRRRCVNVYMARLKSDAFRFSNWIRSFHMNLSFTHCSN